LKILTYTTLFPNTVHPQHGIFVENRLRRIVNTGEVYAHVIAPVPWFPFKKDVFGHYGSLAQIKRSEERFDLSIQHPRYLTIPKVGMHLAPELLYRGTVNRVKRSVEESGPALIDAHYFYPDGVAAAKIGRILGLPVVISARGSDINLISQYEGPRKRMVEAARHCAAIIAVSQSLKERMIEIGIDPDQIHVIPNGVDLDVFSPVSEEAAREVTGIVRPTMVAVGNVLSSKGQDIAIRALTLVQNIDLVIVGAGSDVPTFQKLAIDLGVDDRVRFVGSVPQAELKNWFSASDFSILASMREGSPNVVLESIACGTPVIATDVGGASEIITSPDAGRLMSARTPEALATAIQDLRASPPDRKATRAWAENFSWEPTIEAQVALYRDIVAQDRRS
jgi:teichuronic acid biosynthesis glycosyltransferase TuaC